MFNSSFPSALCCDGMIANPGVTCGFGPRALFSSPVLLRQVRSTHSKSQSHLSGSGKTRPAPLGLTSRSQSAPGRVSPKAFGWKCHPRETSPATACHTCQGTAQTGFWEEAGLGLCCIISYTQCHLRHLGEKGEVMGKTHSFRLHLIS